ncbi:hypothetical protein PybrP1_006472 [[Pythium] brassicae (nom. inval.)]|nr:hypothetical protein PybrP1_006472 [[Pythium] brassicae (nom. inval.)]
MLDGLSNDLFKDVGEVLAQPLSYTFTAIVEGADFLDEFNEGLVIRLRKKGDLPDPFDYRPIAILPTSYKIFASVLAQRLQKHLGTLIGTTQQGFVRRRHIERSVIMMLAILATAESTKGVSLKDSPALGLLDFRKAYDTLDRGFLFMTCRGEGTQTLAAAAERVRGSPGLRVRVHKSCYISLNTVTEQRAVRGISQLVHVDTVRYLGIQVGTGPTTDANWSDRMGKIKAGLRVADAAMTNIPSRVLVLNAVVILAVLFTTNYTKPTLKWL